MTDQQKEGVKEVTAKIFARADEMREKFGLSKSDAVLAVVADQVAQLIVLVTDMQNGRPS